MICSRLFSVLKVAPVRIRESLWTNSRSLRAGPTRSGALLTRAAPSRAPTIEEGIHQRAWLCGPSELVVRELKAYEAEFPGLEHVILRWPEGMPVDRFKRQLTLFADEVMPHFT